MTVAIVALALLAASIAGALVTLGWRHLRHVEGRALEQVAQADAIRQLATERDTARAAATRLGVELNTASAEVEGLRGLLAEAREEIARARIASVTSVPPADAGAAVDRVLEARAAEQASRAAAGGDRRAAAPGPVPGSGSASPGPEPAWVRGR